jgi:hypothetical protein
MRCIIIAMEGYRKLPDRPRPLRRDSPAGSTWSLKGRRGAAVFMATVLLFTLALIGWSYQFNVTYDPLDESPYRGVEEPDAPRCAVAGLCLGPELTCAASRQAGDVRALRDCELARIENARERARVIKEATADTWRAYKWAGGAVSERFRVPGLPALPSADATPVPRAGFARGGTTPSGPCSARGASGWAWG